jgi:hypothetical protein
LTAVRAHAEKLVVSVAARIHEVGGCMTEKNTMISGLGILCALVVALWAAEAGAWPTYSASRDGGVGIGNCVSCHGDYQTTPYVRLGVDQGWGIDLMTGHMAVVNDCFACHMTIGQNASVSMSASGGAGGFNISCLGCHGREEGAGVDGAGLRDHHRMAGASSCADSSCHFGDPTPVGEDILPPYYDLNLAVVSLTDPCNPGGAGEDFAGDSAGLDNDGDLLYDELDVIDCGVAPPEGCEFDWPVDTVTTIAKGQSATQNAKIKHDITGHIVGGAGAYGDTAHRIKICANTEVDIVITCSIEGCPEEGPFITKQVGGDFCTGAGCTVPLAEKFKYVVTTQDGKDTDAVTLLPQ